MLKEVIISFLLGLTFKSFSQQKLLHDSMRIGDSTILIATSSEHKQYEFCITKPNEIAEELERLTYGPVQEAPFEKNPVVIKLVSKGLIIQTWIVKPKASAIEFNNRKFSFDASALLRLAKKYPIAYSIQEKDFEDQAELSGFYSNLLKDKKFLYLVPPDFDNQWQGKFVLTFNKDATFSSPLAISKYLQPKFEFLEKKNKFSIVYQPFDVGKSDGNSRFSMTIYGTRKLYREFVDSLAVKGAWQPQPYRAYIIRRK